MADATWDHWWWRPGWRLGRSFYTWHVTFGDDSPVGQLVERFAPVLQQIPTMAPVTREGLHITVQGVGFTDEVAAADMDEIVAAASSRLSQRAPFDIRIGPPHVDEETIGLPVADPEGLRAVHADLQSAIGDVWGEDRVPERGDRFVPHLSLAYSTGVAAISGLECLLADAGLDNVIVPDRVTAVSLIDLNRDNRRYEWREVAKVPLGG
jgi:2'-5' RNA ligase